ncbi:hypothetical protein BH23CHL4_BH23CHL4_08730 [soil metagenome]
MFASKYRNKPATLRGAIGPVSRILAGLVAIVVLVGCADDESDRQFAGDEQATGPAAESPVQPLPSQPPGMPSAAASPISEQQLFAAHGLQTIAGLIVEDSVYRYDASSGELTILPIGSGYDPWKVDVAHGQEHLAVLVSPNGSLVQWRVLVFDAAGQLTQELPVVGGQASPVASSEVVAAGAGGLDWSPDGSVIAVALPTGGIYAVGLDGSVEQMAPPRRTARPGAIAWSPTRPALAFANQPDGQSGAGLFLATTTAYPLDPVQLLRPDPTGNRSVSYLEWSPDGSRVIAIVDRMETGGARGDVFTLETDGSPPKLIWSSGLHTEAGADGISIAPDGSVLSVLTRNSEGESTTVLRQIGGASEVQRELGLTVTNNTVLWTADGIVIVGETAGVSESEASLPVVIRIDEAGDVSQIGPAATPVASPQPVASPAASAVGTPVAIPIASPAGSPGASPVASPEASPGTADAAD